MAEVPPELRESFNRLDTNLDGYIAKEELFAVFQEIDPETWTDDELSAFWETCCEAADTDKDGYLNQEEFLTWLYSADDAVLTLRAQLGIEGDAQPAPAEEDVVPAPVEEDVVAAPPEEDVQPAPAEEDVKPAEAQEDAVPPAEAQEDAVPPAEAQEEAVPPAEPQEEAVPVAKTLTVKVKSAANLRSADSSWWGSGKSDPYVKLDLFLADGTQVGETQQTSVKDNELNPVWDEEFVFEAPKDPQTCKLVLRIYDSDGVAGIDSLASDDALGRVEVTFEELAVDGGWKDLTLGVAEGQGTLCISNKWSS